MAENHTVDELNKLSKHDLVLMILSMQDELSRMNDSLESLTEQIRIANQQRFGRHSETLESIDGQLSLFDEADATADPTFQEPDVEDILPTVSKKRKQKGKRDKDLSGLPEEQILHDVPEEKLVEMFGEGNYRRMPDETFKRLRYEPASWTVEVHTVEVYVGTGGLHQDEFLRGDRPKDLLRNSIVTPSLEAAIINGKYVNSMPLNRIEQEFERNGLHINRQNMSNWTVQCANRYFKPLYERMKQELFKYHVNQCDETPVQVINEGSPPGERRKPGSKSYMWVHRSGELYKDKQIVLYEYQRTRHHDHPAEFYKNFKGVLMTDGLSQYHLVEKENPNIRNANCWSHARRDFSDAVKAMSDPILAKRSTAYQALQKIAVIFNLEGTLKELSPKERLRERKKNIKPLVDEFFSWVKSALETQLPKGKTAEGLNYCLNQEKYLRVFLEDGEVPIDNSASERAIRTFCIGKKNWYFCDTVKGAEASAVIYSITETAKLNGLSTYNYICYLLTQLPELSDESGDIDLTKLDPLLPWSKELPEKCYKSSH